MSDYSKAKRKYDAIVARERAMTDHLPECECFGLSENAAWQTDCQCDRLRACEQRVTERHNAEHEDDRLAAFQNGYDAATVKERQRSVLRIADAYGKGLSAARDAVAALPGWQGLEWGMYMNDALAAIDALRGESNE